MGHLAYFLELAYITTGSVLYLNYRFLSRILIQSMPIEYTCNKSRVWLCIKGNYERQ
jgi:hypothetical protein